MMATTLVDAIISCAQLAVDTPPPRAPHIWRRHVRDHQSQCNVALDTAERRRA